MKNDLSKYKKTAKSVRKNQIRINNERRILAAAVKILAGYGYQGATMRKIAEEALLPQSSSSLHPGSRNLREFSPQLPESCVHC